MPMLIIGGDGPGKRKRDRIGGGDDYEDESEPSNDEGGGMDMDAKKTEAARLLVKALGASPEATTRVKKALEAFVYACTDEGE